MDDTPPFPPPQPAAPLPPTMSLGARLMNVFAIPGDVFEAVRLRKRSVANWLVPALLTTVVMALMTLVVMSQPAIQQKMREQQEQSLEKMVQAGKLTREQADQQLAMLEKFSGPAIKAVGSVFAGTFYGFGRVFWWATILWLLGRWLLKARFPYVKAMEVGGLAGMIGVLGLIVTMLLQINFSDPNSSPSLALLVDKYDTKNIGHLALGTANVFHIWQAVVLAIALSRLAGVPAIRGAFVFFPFWLILQSLMIAVTVLVSRLTG